MSRGRVTAPFGRRAVAVTDRAQHGPYIVLSCADPDGPRPQAGQFYMLAAAECWGGGAGERPFLPRAFSVMRALPGTDDLAFLIADIGPGTHRLVELDSGDGLALVGPLGTGFAPPREARRPVLVGGGVGIAPLAILQDELGHQIPPPLLGFRDGFHGNAAKELLTPTRIATDDGSFGHHGFVTDLLIDELHLDPHSEVYACGPAPMLEAVRMICAERDVPAQLALESGMACGFGACFGCVVETRDGYQRVCVEGPVFEAARLPAVLG